MSFSRRNSLSNQLRMTHANPRRCWFILMALTLLLFTALVVQAQTEEKFERGVVIEKVVSTGDPTRSYALYLPTAYDTKHKFPILYCFDPQARGPVPVARFKDAAEKYGYIVVGSNNSRNGPNLPLTEIVRDLWADTHARFSIDDARVYLAGMSGGARVAISVGFWLKDRVAGVIACSAGFPTEIPPTTARSFVLFATAGTDDFNNPEMQSLARRIEGSTPPSRLVVFDGGHTWLPAELALTAVAWLEIQAMRSGIRDRDPALINAIFDQALARARSSEAASDSYQAYLQYLALAQDFPGLHDIAEVEKKTGELKASKEVRAGLKQEKEMADEQERRIKSIHTLIAATESSENSFESMSALRVELAEQRKAAHAEQPSAKRSVARRVVESLFIEFIELANTALAQRRYERAITDYFVCTEIQPDNARIFFNLARAQALAGSRSKALSTLQTAAQKGFAGVQELAAKEFEDIQNEKRFKEVLELVRKNQMSHDSKRN
jgi:tetratricopeptide (TPR) repeat protein